MPSLLAAVNQAIANGYTWPAFTMVTSTGQWNRFTTSAPQMARAAIAGTMLPTLIAPLSPVYCIPTERTNRDRLHRLSGFDGAAARLFQGVYEA